MLFPLSDNIGRREWRSESSGNSPRIVQIALSLLLQASTTLSTLWFGDFELLKEYFHAHPILKNTEVAKGEKCYDLISSLPKFPRGQRSKGRVRSDKKTTLGDGSHEGSIVEESQSQCNFDTHSHRPRNMRSKREAKPSDPEVIYERSLHYCRQSTRQHCRTTDIQKLGRLDSGKFEFYLENVWKRFTEEKKNVFTYLDSLWFSSYRNGPLKEKVLSWIKRKDIFSKKYVFVPIVQCPQSKTKSRCMLLLDSLKEANSKQLEPAIRRFVFDIFKTEERPEKKELINKIPLLIPQMKEDWFTPEEVECFVKTLGFNEQ
ncbi:hypothetical protein DH2020_025641 [Rehmannia glutinosa]|uniref:Uncharacterized protein n=1 Tax=Rehmannia glutinosa TaxID=99300 RepID=A0ABR0VZ55_REHGL